MGFISEQDAQRIRQTIEQVERETSGEIVTVITHSSDDYRYIPLLWAALVALMLPAPFVFLDIYWFIDDQYLYQLAAFTVAALVFLISPVRLRLIPVAVRQRRAHRHAMEQFILNGLPATEANNGILLFVSMAEHYVEIIADKGVNERVSEDTWKIIVDDFTTRVKSGAVADGFIEAILRCGEILREHFPGEKNNKDELPNHLIII